MKERNFNEMVDNIISQIRRMPIEDRYKLQMIVLLSALQTRHEWEMKQEIVESNTYDEEEIHENCTVQVLRSSVTGEVSVGWWENEEAEE